MSDFQVGDRVSVEGVVSGIEWVDFDNAPEYVGVDLPGLGETTFRVDQITLVERPRRKLRVGSVWECALAGNTSRFVVVWGDKLACLDDGTITPQDALTIGTKPAMWREVPVEELEREAGS